MKSSLRVEGAQVERILMCELKVRQMRFLDMSSERWPGKPGFDRKKRSERSRRMRRTLDEQLQEWLGEGRADRADHQGGELFHGTKDRESYDRLRLKIWNLDVDTLYLFLQKSRWWTIKSRPHKPRKDIDDINY